MDYGSQPIGEFLSNVASQNVTPAGGTSAAIAGAIGASLCEMVCIHTVDYVEGEDATELTEIREDLAFQRERLLTLATADEEAVDELIDVWGEGAPQPELKRATGVPLTIAEACRNVLDLATVVTDLGNPNALPDAVIGAHLARATLDAMVFTVRCNLGQITDDAFVDEMDRRTDDLERSADRAFERIEADAEVCLER